MKTQNIEFIPDSDKIPSVKKTQGQPDKPKPIVVLLKILPSIQSLIIALVIMFAINWKMTLIVLAFTPAPCLISGMCVLKNVKRRMLTKFCIASKIPFENSLDYKSIGRGRKLPEIIPALG